MRISRRVLFVVQSRFWITGVEARKIMEHNPHIGGLMCSVPLLDELIERAPYLIQSVDLVHFMVPVAGRRYLDRFLGRLPCVATIHHIEPGYLPNAISINAKADSIMIVSEMWRSELISRGVPAESIFLMPNGVDTSVFRPPRESEREQLRQSMGFAPDEVVIGFAGQPGRDNGWRKGLDVFIDALRILVQQGMRIAVAVGGPGWGTALERIGAMGIKTYKRPYVLMAEDGAPMYRAMDFFWVTSRIEGGPAPLMEAMSSSVCCISTKVGIAPEIVRDGINGCLVDIEDAERIAVLTRKLIEFAEERESMGREARKTVLSGYDWSQTARAASLLYNAAAINFERRYSSMKEQYTQVHTGQSQHSVAEAPIDEGGGDAILSPAHARWLESQEQIVWSRELCRMGERGAALGLGWHAGLAHPLSMRTWSFLANLVLPARVLDLGRSAARRLNARMLG